MHIGTFQGIMPKENFILCSKPFLVRDRVRKTVQYLQIALREGIFSIKERMKRGNMDGDWVFQRYEDMMETFQGRLMIWVQ